MGICVPGEVRWTLLTLLNFKIEFWSYLDRYCFWKVILYMTGDVLESSSGQSYYSEKRKKKDKSQNKTPLTAMLGCCSACAEGHVGGKPDLICMVTSSGPWILWRVLLPLLSGQGRWVTVAQNFAFVFYRSGTSSFLDSLVVTLCLAVAHTSLWNVCAILPLACFSLASFFFITPSSAWHHVMRFYLLSWSLTGSAACIAVFST